MLNSRERRHRILFSLVVVTRCRPCFEVHARKALDLGITQAELDEAAWCAIALGGAPVKMFYQECLALIQPGETGRVRGSLKGKGVLKAIMAERKREREL